MKVIDKVNKKAWVQIKQISQAKNMLEVESAIGEAVLRSFGLWNIGLMKIAMRKVAEGDNGYVGLQKEYGCHSWNNDFERMKEIRDFNLKNYKSIALQYLYSFIPSRIRSVAMFKKMMHEI